MSDYKIVGIRRYRFLLITGVVVIMLQACGGDSSSPGESSTGEAAVVVPTGTSVSTPITVLPVATSTKAPAVLSTTAPVVAVTKVPAIEPTKVPTITSGIVKKYSEPSSTPVPTLVATAVPTKVPDSPTATPVPTVVSTSGETQDRSRFGRQTAYPTAVAITVDHVENARKVFPFERFDNLQSCTSGSSKDEQRQVLLNMAQTLFAGNTSSTEDDKVKPRITHLGGSPVGPAVRDDRRSGGLWVVVEFNGDDNGEVVEKKASIDLWMMEAYNAFFNADCDQLAKVEISAYGTALGRHPIGPAAKSWAIVFKTRVDLKIAEKIDWVNRDPVDINGIWQVMILNYRWKEALAGRKVGGVSN